MAKRRKARRVKKTKAKPRKSLRRARAKTPRRDGGLEEALRETFPGSDPLALTDPTRGIKE
jgi:hypothetical protein